MSQQNSDQDSVAIDADDSAWFTIAKWYAMAYLLPGLLFLALEEHVRNQEQAVKDQHSLNQRLQATATRMEESRIRLLDGTATETDLRTFGIDDAQYKEYLRNLAIVKQARENGQLDDDLDFIPSLNHMPTTVE